MFHPLFILGAGVALSIFGVSKIRANSEKTEEATTVPENKNNSPKSLTKPKKARTKKVPAKIVPEVEEVSTNEQEPSEVSSSLSNGDDSSEPDIRQNPEPIEAPNNEPDPE